MAQEFNDPCSDKSKAISLEGTPVKLVIGPEERVLYTHESVLCKSSKFFQAALNTQWAEGRNREVKLPEEEFDTVTTYLQWLYRDTVASKVPGEHRQRTYAYPSKLYVLGERLLDAEFQNRIIDAIIVNIRERVNGLSYLPIGEAVNTIYENTPKSSPARQLMVEIWYCHGGPKWVKDPSTELNAEFMEDLVVVFLSERERPKEGSARQKRLYEGIPDAFYKQD